MPAPPPQTRPTPSLHLNWQDWLPYLAECDGSDEDKRQFIEIMWSIGLSFVELGWDVDFFEEVSGQRFDLCAALRAAVIESEEDQELEEDV
jgi:hypothetical protein